MYVLDSTYCQAYNNYTIPEMRISNVKLLYIPSFDGYAGAFTVYDDSADTNEYVVYFVHEGTYEPDLQITNKKYFVSPITSGNFAITGGLLGVGTAGAVKLATIGQDRLHVYTADEGTD